jgi:hypothetical protein
MQQQAAEISPLGKVGGVVMFCDFVVGWVFSG